MSKSTKSTKTASAKSADEPTPLMLAVAAKVPGSKAVKKALSPLEIEELLARLKNGETLEKEEKAGLRKEYTKSKKWLVEKETGNLEYLYLLPNIVSDDNWLKVFNFSALCYTYRIAGRMGRRANITEDTDRASKCEYAASIAGGIERFREEIERLGIATFEGLQNGVYVFRLKRPVSIDEYGQMRKHEADLKEKAHNALRPKNANPVLYNDILFALRQVTPKAVRISKVLYHALGDELVRNLAEMMHVYQDYCTGVYEDKATAGFKLVTLCDSVIAMTITLVECRVWTTEVAASVGENMNKIKRTVINEFGIKKV